MILPNSRVSSSQNDKDLKSMIALREKTDILTRRLQNIHANMNMEWKKGKK